MIKINRIIIFFIFNAKINNFYKKIQSGYVKEALLLQHRFSLRNTVGIRFQVETALSELIRN